MSQHPPNHETIWRGLLYGQRSLWLRLTARLKRDFGLTAAQYEALAFLRLAPERELQASQLAERMLYSSGSASHLFARLEERGLVTRATCSQDARITLVRLTPAGLALAREAGAAHREDLAREFAGLVRPEEEEVLLRFAHRLEESEGLLGPLRGTSLDHDGNEK